MLIRLGDIVSRREGEATGPLGARRFLAADLLSAIFHRPFSAWSSVMSLDETLRILATVEPGGLTLDAQVIENNPDAALVALGRSFEALSAELATLQQQDAQSAAATCDAKSQVTTVVAPCVERIEAVLSSLDPIERAIMAIPARTVVGLGVKARHAAHVLSNYWTDVPERLDWDARTVRQLIESACSVAGVELS